MGEWKSEMFIVDSDDLVMLYKEAIYWMERAIVEMKKPCPDINFLHHCTAKLTTTSIVSLIIIVIKFII